MTGKKRGLLAYQAAKAEWELKGQRTMTEAAAMKLQPLTLQEPPHTAPLPAVARVPMTPMEMLSKAVNDGAAMEVLEKLMLLQERWQAGQARRAFDEAIAAAKAEIPVITKNRKVGYESKKAETTNGKVNYKHEDLGEIARTVDPILARYGLSYRFRSTQEQSAIAVTCIVSHKDGHFEETTLKGGADNSGSKNSIQAVGSTITYLSRYTLKLALGLAASAADDDDGRAADGPAPINDAQLDELIALADASGAHKGRFCQHFGIDGLAHLPAAKFAEAKALLQAKQRQAAAKAKEAQKAEAADAAH